jgi:CRP/FNR family transcriptional regulator, anaerobic regulatory protein
MLNTAISTAHVRHDLQAGTPANDPAMDPWSDAEQLASRHINEMLALLQDTLAPRRRMVHAGDRLYRAGECFGNLYILNSGSVKMVTVSPDGREQVVGLEFRGDWLGFDGIASAQYACDAIAMDTGEAWVVCYDAVLAACAAHPALLAMLHQAMSREIARDRDWLMSVCTLPADARVADFLCFWAKSLARRGLRTDQITLRLTRAEIGNCLGLTLESVSRAMCRMEREGIIALAGKARREVRIPRMRALAGFAERCLTPMQQ